MSINEYEIFPKNIQTGGNIGFSINRLVRILKIFLTLSYNKSFDENLNLFGKNGQIISNANLAELLELTQTKQDRLLGLDDFVYQLQRANIDLNLITNSNIRERLRASREGSSSDNGNGFNHPGDSSGGGEQQPEQLEGEEMVNGDDGDNNSNNDPNINNDELEPIPGSSNQIQVGDELETPVNPPEPSEGRISPVIGMNEQLTAKKPGNQWKQHHVAQHSECQWYVDDESDVDEQMEIRNQEQPNPEPERLVEDPSVIKRRKYRKRTFPYKANAYNLRKQRNKTWKIVNNE